MKDEHTERHFCNSHHVKYTKLLHHVKYTKLLQDHLYYAQLLHHVVEYTKLLQDHLQCAKLLHHVEYTKLQRQQQRVETKRKEWKKKTGSDTWANEKRECGNTTLDTITINEDCFLDSSNWYLGLGSGERKTLSWIICEMAPGNKTWEDRGGVSKTGNE